jgi:Protein of unknown function (DUF1566)
MLNVREGTKEIEPGERMADGTVYAGISPDTKRPMYTTPADGLSRRWLRTPRLFYTFAQARKYAEELDAHGHKDWRVPTRAELKVLFSNRAVIGGFNETGLGDAGWYWSSSETSLLAWGQRFSDGRRGDDFKIFASSVRCVRG